MPSPAHEMVVQMLRNQPVPEETPTLAESRAGYEEMVEMFALAADVTTESTRMGDVPCEWVRTGDSRNGFVLLYLHGGGYVIGSMKTHRELVSRLGRVAGAEVLNVDYRLAPEHPFPAAVEDATAAYRGLLASGVEAGHVVIAGDSAGGGLTLATLLALRDAGDPLPAGGVCLSLWGDLEGTSASYEPGAIDDPLLTLEQLTAWGEMYAGGELRNPLAAPVHADYAKIPPLLLQVGTRELVLDDSIRVAAKAKAAGVDVTLEKRDGLIHVWQMFGPMVPESVEAVANAGAFFRKHAG